VRSSTRGAAVVGPRGFVLKSPLENLRVPARVWRETVCGLLETDRAATLRGILVPTLVLGGDVDGILPRADQQRILDAVLGVRLLVYEGVGHALHQEAPERLVQDAAFAADVLPDRRDGDAPGAGRDAAAP
jgi:pimeloyl-ACP methyl ester carboxylesterase